MSDKQTKNIDGSKKLLMPSKKHLEFIECYLVHFNASKAYRQVFGDSSGHASESKAYELLKRGEVQQYLQRRLAERKAALHVDTQHVVRKLTEIIEADFTESTAYLTKDQLLKIPENIRKLVQSVELVRTKTKTSNHREDTESTMEKYKVTFMSKDNALTLLGKHTGAFIKDNVSANVNLDQMTFTDALKKLDI